MSDADWKIPAIKYHQLHGLNKSHPIPKTKYRGSEFEIGSIRIFAWWRNRVENTYHKYKSYSDLRIIVKSSLLSMVVPFLYFDFFGWIYWFGGGQFFKGPMTNPNEPISVIILAPIIETLVFFFPLLEIARIMSLPRWVSYPLIFFFFESLHAQRSFFEHPFMWMTGYMFIVAYEAGRTRSLLHAILFCTIVHEAYNVSCYLLNPSLYPSPF